MEGSGLIVILLIMAVLPTGYTDGKEHTELRRLPAVFLPRLNTCLLNKWRFLKDEKFLTW